METGDTIGGRFELIEPLGSGLSGDVWRAYDTALQRDVALKRFRRVRGMASSHQRFLSEPIITARASHPNIISIFASGVDGRVPWFAMEFIPGARTLTERLNLFEDRGTRPPLRACLDVGRQLLRALHKIHTLQFIHRDIKPDNILIHEEITGEWTIKLIDFGLAKDPNLNLTSSGEMFGSPDYMAPERFLYDGTVGTRPPDHRQDLFSVGVVIYEALTLHTPYDHLDTFRHAARHYAQTEIAPQPPSSRRSDLPPEIDAWLLKLLRWDPKDRFQNASTALRRSNDFIDVLAPNQRPASFPYG